ncbi:MAG: LptF/LptG family permease, partial [Nitrospirae bacterium]|nr:LptF/LptG family permease [Nitrospirota bacterium]
IVERVHAEEAVFRENRWFLKKGTRWSFHDGGRVIISHFDETPAGLSIQLHDLPKMTLQGREMKFGELQSYVERLRREGYEVRKLTVDLYSKTSFPLAGSIDPVHLSQVEKRVAGKPSGCRIVSILLTLPWAACYKKTARV